MAWLLFGCGLASAVLDKITRVHPGERRVPVMTGWRLGKVGHGQLQCDGPLRVRRLDNSFPPCGVGGGCERGRSRDNPVPDASMTGAGTLRSRAWPISSEAQVDARLTTAMAVQKSWPWPTMRRARARQRDPPARYAWRRGRSRRLRDSIPLEADLDFARVAIGPMPRLAKEGMGRNNHDILPLANGALGQAVSLG
jgi:hypothetical protein